MAHQETKKAETHPRFVEDLLDAAAYPSEVPPVEMVETHISFIFFAGDYVYKVKKPVDYGFLDFTTLEKRRYYCEREVELNRRISPDVYLGVAEIRERFGRHVVEGPGRTVEYAVKMRRLASGRSLDKLLQGDMVSANDVRRIARMIARFHSKAERGPEIAPHGDLEAVRRNVEENFAQTRRFVGLSLPEETYDELQAYSRAFMYAKRDLFLSRVREGYIRDCHGDLRADHVFLETPTANDDSDGIRIIDCIEFNERFRYSDVAEEIAFLAMDLEYHGMSDLARIFVDAYVEETNDRGATELLDFYKAYRAYVRGKVASFNLDDSELPMPARENIMESARAYFRLACSYIPSVPRPAMILVTGVTGTGKSTVASDLSRRWSMPYISSDVTRKRLTGVDPKEHRYEPFMEGIYSPRHSELTYQKMLRDAREYLQEGESVVLDGTFRHSYERELMLEEARLWNAEAWIVECRLQEEEARLRLERRSREGDSISDGRWEIYREQLRQWEPVVEAPPGRHITLHTDGSREETMRCLMQRLYESILNEGILTETTSISPSS